MRFGCPFPMPRGVIAAFLLLVFVCSVGTGTETCSFPGPPTVVLKDEKRLLQYWEVEDSAKWTSGFLPDSAGYWRFVRFVRSRLDVSEVHRYVSAPDLPTTQDKQNSKLMLSGGIGDLRPIDCLEALLFSVQAQRHPMETQPTEFLALILRRDDEGKGPRLKIWYFTVDQPGIGRPGPITDSAEKDVAAGWKPFLNLHNHNFFFDKTPIVPGAAWPSANDVQVMKNLSFHGLPLERTAVTDGFITSHLRPDELKRLRGADE
ncbi:MAG: hypothetical protein HY077_15290 [Elusimicrobia bacterium]|nr:hypothetical protein [Elusimicrobiota bacterium]